MRAVEETDSEGKGLERQARKGGKKHETKQKIQRKPQVLPSRALSMLLKTSQGHKPHLLTSA